MPYVAKQTARVAGSRDMVVEGRVYDDDNPVVRAHPWLFHSPDDAAQAAKPKTNTADLGDASMSARSRKKVEQATAAPGETRDVGYDCPDCDYEGTSEHGLKIHRGRAHA